MEPLKEIGSKIKFYRIQKHMTIKDLAESICKSQATLYKYEKGKLHSTYPFSMT
ncbi:helix-turn-helix domain-containing protein [Acidaminococcus intestini]|nr:helix-turn-helix domain-containing protein [Acidaminococcus intestini]